MPYLILAIFILAMLYPYYYHKSQQKNKAYFAECLSRDIYYPNTDYIRENDMMEPVKSDKAVMLEIAEKYMKNPDFEDEYLRRYKLGFELYREENREDLEAYLLKRHEEKMKDPDYASAYETYAKLEKKGDVQGRLYKKFKDVRDAKPSKKNFKENVQRLRSRKEK